jgi:4-amino-4-deoxy-L-arabinose transferase-like glycosyltransferase
VHWKPPRYWGLWLLFLIFYGYALFWKLDAYRLEFYDESRRAVNALEMLRGESHWLAPTFGGAPDHWGTKPPLLVWLQAACMALLGPTDLAVRLPAALAALATIALFIWFGRQILQRPWAGWLAGLVLVTIPLYIGNHGARSGDYDALLGLFLTGQLLFSYAYIDTGRRRYLLLAGAALLLAGWTKGIAGCFFLPAIGLFFLADPRGRECLIDWQTWAVYTLALLGILAYYPLREGVDPGYLQLVWDNELGGRYLEVKEISPQPWYFFLQLAWEDRLYGSWLWLVPVGLVRLWLRPRWRSLAFLLGITALSFWAIVSYSATKHFWYILPLLFPVALLVGIGLDGLVAVAQKQANGQRRAWALTLLVCLFLGPGVRILAKIDNYKHYQGMRSQIVYGDHLKHLRAYDPYTVLLPEYSAHGLFYSMAEQERGEQVAVRYLRPPGGYVQSGAQQIDTLRAGDRVLLCENETWVYIDERYQLEELVHRPPCKLVEITGRKGNDLMQ